MSSATRTKSGIDLSDKAVPAHADFGCTDLYIPRIPYRTNQSLTHYRRAQELKSAEILEAARTLKQGMGRLVRREGLLERHIWIGDQRLTKGTGNNAMLRKLFAPYHKVAEGSTFVTGVAANQPTRP